jgi:molybdate transport system substrate-binding protein
MPTKLTATSIAYSDGGNGTYLSTVLFSRLGVAGQVAGKSRKVRGPPSGEPVAAVAREPEAGSALLRFLGSPEAQPAILRAGLTPAAARQRATWQHWESRNDSRTATERNP